VVLVVASSLLLRSIREILSSDANFRPQGVLTVAMDFGSTDYSTHEERGEDIRALEQEFEALPGVTAVGFVNHLPTQPTSMTGGIFEPPWPETGTPERMIGGVGWRVVDEDYFRAMGIPLLEGRVFGEEDGLDSPPVIVLNQSAARTLYPNLDALGQRVQFVPFWEEVDLEVVGVVAEARDWRVSPGEQAEGFIFWPQRVSFTRYLTAVIRTTGDPALLTNPVRERMRNLTPTVPGTIQTLEAVVSDSFRDRSFTLTVLGAFAALSLLLAAVGIYGVVSYTVSARTREIGIQLALGAGPGRLRRETFLRSAQVVVGGALAGLVLALGLGTVMGSILYGVNPRDPVVLATAPIILLTAATLAIGIPVIRYTQVDLASTMRED
jgi:putative ABC transport system permease protein